MIEWLIILPDYTNVIKSFEMVWNSIRRRKKLKTIKTIDIETRKHRKTKNQTTKTKTQFHQKNR